MVQVIKQTQVITEKIQTVQGEITVNLNLTITLNSDGSLKIGTSVPQQAVQKAIETPEIPDTKFIIPDFEETTELLPNFGEDVGG